MTIGNNTVNINQQDLNITAIDPKEEELLSWLQEFHATTIKPLAKDLPEDIPDDQISTYNPFRDIKTLKAYSLMISNIDNPGWLLKFALSSDMLLQDSLSEVIIDDQVLENGDVKGNWLRTCLVTENNMFRGVGGALCLSAILCCFRAQIERKKLVTENEITYLQNIRSTAKDNNKLLTWLEDFYFSYCDDYWEHMYGFIIISCHLGWIIECYVGETDIAHKQFNKISRQNRML